MNFCSFPFTLNNTNNKFSLCFFSKFENATLERERERKPKRWRTEQPSNYQSNYMSTNFLSTMSFEEFENLDILAWWKEKQGQFPVLAVMARDLLTVQASTVTSESAFSVSGRVISQRRSRLSPKSVECCICLKDYLDGVVRQQHLTTLEEPMDADYETNLYMEEVELGISPPPEADDEEEDDDDDE